jgi:serine/threonine-protein kinase
MALLARHSLDNVPSLKIVRGTVPDAVEDAIVRAMAKVPADRFRSATDFSNALLDNEGAARRRRDSMAAKAIAATTVQTPALGAPTKSKLPMVIGAAAAVAVIGAGGAWYALKGRTSGPPAGLAGEQAKTNIAVMYFDDRSPKKELGYLADGLTEALIDELSAVPQLKVASRNASATMKGKGQVGSDSIGRALGVGTVINGVVAQTANGVRVTVRLDDAVANSQMDKVEIEQSGGDMLALQDSVARRMSEMIRQKIGKEIQEVSSKVGTSNAAAWEALQRAKQLVNEQKSLIASRAVPAAIAKAEQADSAFAKVEAMDANWRTPIDERAWLAYPTARLLRQDDPEFKRWIERGLSHADRAIAKDPNDATAIEARGTLHYLQWLTNLAPNAQAAAALLTSAEADLRNATTINTRAASANNTLSHLLLNKGKPDEAKLAAEAAYNTDPYLANIELTIHRLVLVSLDQKDRVEAEKWCNTGRSRFPEHYRFTECKLWLYALPASTKPDMREVWKTYDDYVKVSPQNVQEFDKLKGKMMVGLAYLRAGMPDSAKALAASAQGDREIDPRAETVNLAAIIYAQAGDKDKAIDLVAKWLAANPQQRALASSNRTWWLDSLNGNPRYEALIKPTN